MKSKSLKRIFICAAGLYAAIFVPRTIYDLFTYEDSALPNYSSPYYESDYSGTRNYASQATTYTLAGNKTVLDLKYERIADIRMRTADYDSDLTKLNNIIREHNAVIQAENREGTTGKRSAEFIIGVTPEDFDRMEESVTGIGNVVSLSASKKDKTYEYNKILAEKAVLDQRLQSYKTLKKKGGSVSEMLSLEDKIIEVEALIQDQMISLSAFSDENAMCTITLIIYEGGKTTVFRKFRNSFIWTTQTYFLILLGASGIALVVFFMETVWNYTKKTLVIQPEDEENSRKINRFK